jgi:hypothetical protein
VPLQSCYRRQEDLLGDQPSSGAIKQNTGTVSAGPAKCVQPSIQAELCHGLAEITKAAMPPNLRGVVPTSLALAVVEKATELFDLDLPGEAVDNAVWYVGKVLKKSTQEARRAELDGEAQAVVVAAMGVDQPPVAIIQVEIPGHLVRAEFSGEAAVTVPLLFG